MTGNKSKRCFTGAGIEKKSRTFLVDFEKEDWSSAIFSVFSFGGIEKEMLVADAVDQLKRGSYASPRQATLAAASSPSLFRVLVTNQFTEEKSTFRHKFIPESIYEYNCFFFYSEQRRALHLPSLVYSKNRRWVWPI
jgi:hypothetical protein